jgi:hypothetical protein
MVSSLLKSWTLRKVFAVWSRRLFSEQNFDGGYELFSAILIFIITRFAMSGFWSLISARDYAIRYKWGSGAWGEAPGSALP